MTEARPTSEPVPDVSESTGLFVLPSIIVGAPLILAGIRYMANRQGKEG